MANTSGIKLGLTSITFNGSRTLPDDIGKTPEMAEFLRPYAEDIAKRVKQIGPKDDDAPHYVDMVTPQVELIKRPGGAGGGWRAVYVARVNAWKFTSHWIEFGSVHNPPYAPLRRATEAAGLRFEDTKGL